MREGYKHLGNVEYRLYGIVMPTLAWLGSNNRTCAIYTTIVDMRMATMLSMAEQKKNSP